MASISSLHNDDGYRRGVTVYEVMMRPADHFGEHMLVVASGREQLLKAWEYLDGQARQQQIPETSVINMYNEVTVSGRLAKGLLDYLGPATNDDDRMERSMLGPIELDRDYEIYLSEL